MMKQKDIPFVGCGPTGCTPRENIGGNPDAKTYAEKGREALSITAPPTREVARAAIKKILNNEMFDPGKIHIPGTTVRDILNDNKRDLLTHYIMDGTIDRITMEWTDQNCGRDGLICFCLHPGCSIGPFISIRGSKVMVERD